MMVSRSRRFSGRRLLHGLEQAVAFHQLGKYILQNIFGLGGVGHPPLDKPQQAAALLAHRRLYLLVLAGGGGHERGER